MESKSLNVGGRFKWGAIGFSRTVEGQFGRVTKYGEVCPASECPGEVDKGHIIVIVAYGKLSLACVVEQESDGGNGKGLAEDAWR